MERTNRVLMIYAGGSIGMKDSPQGYVPAPGQLADMLASMPQFYDRTMPALTTPLSRYGRRIHYAIVEYEPLLDAANMGADDWVKIARTIEEAYDHYDAFVVLHGIDTMAYTASALSFMLENLRKTVILTGAQLPLAEARSDAIDNVLGALTIAGHYEIPEVCIYSNHKLLRGNRTRRTDTTGIEAFQSGNFPALVHVGLDIRVEWERIQAPPSRPFRVRPIFAKNVAAIRLFPGISAELLDTLLKSPVEGVVLESFGAGNAPDRRPDFLNALRAGVERGVLIVNVSQCQRGAVPADDDGPLAEIGVISGGDMTPEAALTKLGYLLSCYRDRADVARLMRVNLRGELTLDARQHHLSFRERVFIAAVARALGEAGESATRVDVERALMPVLMCSAGGLGDTTALARLITSGADVDAADYDGRTALHLAAAEGHVAAVELLLGKGARVDVTDRWGGTPLHDAVRHRRRAVVTLLLRQGARLRGNFAAELCALAAAGDSEGLGLWIEAGVDHSSADYDGRTALHLAAAEGRLDALRLLLACGADPRAVDRWGSTPLHEARRANHQAAIDLLAAHLAAAT